MTERYTPKVEATPNMTDLVVAYIEEKFGTQKVQELRRAAGTHQMTLEQVIEDIGEPEGMELIPTLMTPKRKAELIAMNLFSELGVSKS